MKILVTGAAGFIGFHLCKKLIELDYTVVGIDNINDYYDVKLKYKRLSLLGFKEHTLMWNKQVNSSLYNKMSFVKIDISKKTQLLSLFKKNTFDLVCNLAAQAGVRYSIENPDAYISTNILGFSNVIELCKEFKIPRLVYASSSSVYGNSPNVPFKESDKTDNPVSLYAASKKSNELIATSYANLFNMDLIGLRFFTVYGPFGRPDMAPFLFSNSILGNKTLNVFNSGNLSRDFTYIDDIIDGIIITFGIKNSGNQVFNIGNNSPTKLLYFIELLENNFKKKSKKVFLDMQLGDVHKTWASVDKLFKHGYSPKISIEQGVEIFAKWFYKYYNNKL